MEQLGRLPTWETAQTDAITDYFFNQSTGQLEWWRRRFTPQELGGVQNSFTKTTGKTIGLSTGFRGSFAQDWDYEAALSYSRYKAKVAWPRIIADVARSEEHTYELPSLTRISYAVFCLNKKKNITNQLIQTL